MSEQKEQWWSSVDAANYLGVSRGHFNRMKNTPGFPTPRRLPSPNGQARPRWKNTEIMAWMEGQS